MPRFVAMSESLYTHSSYSTHIQNREPVFKGLRLLRLLEPLHRNASSIARASLTARRGHPAQMPSHVLGSKKRHLTIEFAVVLDEHTRQRVIGNTPHRIEALKGHLNRYQSIIEPDNTLSITVPISPGRRVSAMTHRIDCLSVWDPKSAKTSPSW